ncbi:MAG TPA: Gfo/Idh/MocA family oxidoreductase [Acidimicrobiia bacterium]|nr:Gfo/Idh/MocA family oxidoreductase [Acidimicrobiia bacterium]
MPSPLSIALVGCGNWGKHILRDLVSLGCQVSVVARSEASTTRAREGGAHTIVNSIEDLKTQQGIVVAVPTTLHAEVLESVLKVGVPVFVEKPLTNDPVTARRFELRDDLFVMDKWRYHPGVEMLRDCVQDGRFGGIRGLQTVRHGFYNSHSDVDAIWILLPHDLSIILEVTGEVPRPIAAAGHIVEGEANLIGILEGGVGIDVASRSNVYRREVRVWFETAVVTLSDAYSDALDVRRTVAGKEPVAIQLPLGSRPPLEAELEAFLGFLRGGPPPRSSAAEGALVVERVQQLRDLAGI